MDDQPPYYGLLRLSPRFGDGHWVAMLTLDDGRQFEGVDPDDPAEAVKKAVGAWVEVARGVGA